MLVKHRLQQIFDVSNTHNSIDILVVDRNARETRLAHNAQDFADSCGILHSGHVDTRNHNLADNSVTHLDDLVDHGFFFFGEIPGILNDVAKLLLGDLLVIVSCINAHKLSDRICCGRRDEHQWARNLHERPHRTDHGLSHCLGVC